MAARLIPHFDTLTIMQFLLDKYKVDDADVLIEDSYIKIQLT